MIHPMPETRSTANASVEEAAAMLLLRSPRLSVSRILDLLDVTDAQFREMCARNRRITELLEARRTGTLADEPADLVTCPGCGDWFVPYGGARCCSDECRIISRIEGICRA
jgi:hypothetical protein